MADLGIDVGSISVNTVLVDGGDTILEDHYDYCRGRPFAVARARIADILARHGTGSVTRIAFTGTGGPLAARLVGGTFVNEIVAQAASVCRLVPGARTVIEMGGEDTKLIFLRDGSLWDFVMNSICAAGTGSFLDQQARRIDVPLEREFGRLALQSEKPPRIAGRCSVFAKSDMIHLQQIATPVHDIIAGLCMAVARNVKSTLARGRGLEPPVVFQGGVAANAGMVRAFREVFGLPEIIVPAHHASMGALGAVFHAREHAADVPFRGLEELDRYLRAAGPDGDHLAPLHAPRREATTLVSAPVPEGALLPVFLGVDVGSLSTNVVLIDGKNNVVARRYLPTAGRPLEAVQKGVREVGEEAGARVVVRAAGTTGSGRYLTGDFVGADIIVNEITAQATAAVSIDPDVDTIFEIGGQDSKYVSVDHGVVVDFEMNKVCAAGTGSFLEEQAEKLGVQIVGEFGSHALAAHCPARLGDRCTVFMESDLNTHQQKGTGRDDLIAGLAYSIAQNYLTKVVGDKRVGSRIFFQGGVAYNKAVVSAFEKVVGREITVPPHFDVTGAIGAAMIARDTLDGGGGGAGRGPTRFKGFAVAERDWTADRFTCTSCANQCDISRVRVQGERKPLYYGGRCERYEVAERKDKGRGIPNLFEERTKLLLDGWSEKPAARAGPVIGIPRALPVFYQSFPWWRAFFESLGMQVVLSRPTDPALVARSLESLTAETCFPVEVMHGHVLDLLEKGVDAVLLPFVVNEEADRGNPTSNCNCPWIQTYPFMVRGCVRKEGDEAKLLVPTLHFRYSRRLLGRQLCGFMEERFGTKPGEVRRAMGAAFRAQAAFSLRLRARGELALASLPAGKTGVVILGRPYNTGDPGLNLRIVEKLINLDVVPVPLDFLPLAREGIFAEYPSMYWPNGRRILQAARIIRRDDRLQAVYLGNFRCGPDSFISHYVREEMRGKPYLQVEMDEHSADAGLVTRLEAFLDSITARARAAGSAARVGGSAPRPVRAPVSSARAPRAAAGGPRTLYFPYMADGAHALAAACRCVGIAAEVLPPLTEADLALGRAHTSSRECFPMICTTGSFLRKLQEPGVDPAAVSFFMPDHNGPCRFGQYNRLQRIVFDRAGFQDVSIVHPSNEDSYASLVRGVRGVRFRLAVWRGMVAVDILRKLLQERAPYERQPGAAREVYDRQLRAVVSCVERGGAGMEETVREAAAAFRGVEVLPGKRRPVISVVGEIFMRDNPFCNGDIVRRLEALGAETCIGPVRDWVSYSTFRYTRDSRRRGRPAAYLKSKLQGCLQGVIEERLVHIASIGGVEMQRDIPLDRMMQLSDPYVRRDYDGDPIIAIGSSAGQAATGISGVVNILPFTCLPGTVISSVAPRLCDDHGGIPWINVAYDGQEDVGSQTRLEAFVYRAHEFARGHGYDAPRQWPAGT